MYFRNKAALAAEHARLNNNNIECHSPMNRILNNNTNNDTTSSNTTTSTSIQTLQPISLSFSSPILDITSKHHQQQQQWSEVNSPNLSPRAEECHFFPRIGRSNSEILLRRTTSNSNNSSSNSNNTRNHSSGLNLIERMDSPNRNTKTPNLEESELANLISDDIESFSVNLQAIDTTTTDENSNNSNNNSSNSNNSSDNILYTIIIRIFHSIYTPIEHIVRTLMPSLHPQIPHFITGNTTSIGSRNSVVCQTQVSLKRAILVLVCCITAIGVLAVTIVIFSEAVISQLGFSSTAMGATLVALGAEVC